MQTMTAAVRERYGPPNVLQVKQIAKPTPGDNHILIKVHATTANRTDCGYLRARPFIVRFFSGLIKPKHATLGNEFAGEVVEAGAGVTTFQVGDRVFGYNDTQFGGHAQYLVMPANGFLRTIPERLSFAEAAPGIEGSHYALSFIRAANVQPGQHVLVNGATGAIGSAAVQLLKHFGAEVTAVANTKNLELVTRLGADTVVDYEREDFTTRSTRYDVIIDAVGKSTFRRCRPLLKPGGIYLSSELGRGAQNPLLALVTSRVGDKKVMFPVGRFPQADLDLLRTLLETGEFTPVIDKHHPLTDIVAAFRYVERGEKTGNVVITVEHEKS